MGIKQWKIGKVDKKSAIELSQECDIDSFSALLLSSKGIVDSFEVEEFLSDEITLADPYDFVDMSEAVDRIQMAIDNEEKIAIFGDYDCDGVTSTVLMYEVLTDLKADVIWRLPSRNDGYGLSKNAVDEFKELGINLIVTVDNGITAFEAIDYANENDIDVVVTDHHLPSEKLPNAYAIVDPKREENYTEFQDYAGVGVAFMVCSALVNMRSEEMITRFGDLVCLGTISDVMPLLYDNRTIVKVGLNLINHRTRPGITSLIKYSGLKGIISSTNIGFALAPRINAAGRIGNPSLAVELLLAEDKSVADSFASQLNEANSLRQELEKQIIDEALQQINENPSIAYAPVIIVCGNDWHQGVLGIVAAKLMNIFSKPAIVLKTENDEIFGSCRSFDGVSIYNVLSNCVSELKSFGGHDSAAGLTIAVDNYQNAVSSICESAKKLYNNMPFEQLNIVCKLNPNAITLSSVHSQKVLEPFGKNNEVPEFAIMNMKILNIYELSNGKHLKLLLSRDGAKINVMKFFTTKEEFMYKIGDIIDVAVKVTNNFYKDTEQLSIIADDVRLSSFDDSIFLKIREYDLFKYYNIKPNNIDISRNDVAVVYKAIRAKKELILDEKSVSYFLKLDYLKARIIIDILEELDFISVSVSEKIKISYINNVENKSLEQSTVFNLFQ